MNYIIGILAFLLGGGVGFFIAYSWWQQSGKPKSEAAHANLESELNLKRRDVTREIEQLEKDGQANLQKLKLEADRMKLEAEREIERRFAELARAEGHLEERIAQTDKQQDKLEQKDQKINKRQSLLDKRENALTKTEEEHLAKLEEIAQMTTEAARQDLFKRVEQESQQDVMRIIRSVEEKAREQGEVLARKHIATAIQRVASDYVAETTTAGVEIPSEEMKGRIIGRNGRNIRAFEQALGVDIVIDDTPELVSVSSFDPVRREIGRRALEKLITDGRIHPARIEKLVKDVEKEVDKVIKDAGDQAAFEANVHNLHREVLKMLGRLKFRTSYGQNQLHHSIETSKIAAMLAAELGADIEVAKMGGLLHDLGKAMDHNQEGTHAMLGAEFAKRFRVPTKVINAIAAHHHEVEQESVEAIIVEAADAISGARPGARRESLELYIKRVRTLEEIAMSFNGVEQAFALQAGREIRVLVKPELIDDVSANRLARDIAKSIEDNMQYPGQIQVTIVRETRAVHHAK